MQDTSRTSAAVIVHITSITGQGFGGVKIIEKCLLRSVSEGTGNRISAFNVEAEQNRKLVSEGFAQTLTFYLSTSGVSAALKDVVKRPERRISLKAFMLEAAIG
jgi:hypothetical protein